MPAPTRRAFAVVAAAALLVVGVDYATYATTGSSLLLGKANHTTQVTSIQRANPGPALRLHTSSAADAPMKVNGFGKVVHLNADKVDGLDARQLASNTISYQAGHRRDMIQAGVSVWSTPLKPGQYEVSFRGIVLPTEEPQPGSAVICGIVDSTRLVGDNPHIYVAQSAALTENFPAAVSGSNTVLVTKAAKPALVCAPTQEVWIFKKLQANFTKVTSREVRDAQPVAVPQKAKWAKRVLGIR